MLYLKSYNSFLLKENHSMLEKSEQVCKMAESVFGEIDLGFIENCVYPWTDKGWSFKYRFGFASEKIKIPIPHLISNNLISALMITSCALNGKDDVREMNFIFKKLRREYPNIKLVYYGEAVDLEQFNDNINDDDYPAHPTIVIYGNNIHKSTEEILNFYDVKYEKIEDEIVIKVSAESLVSSFSDSSEEINTIIYNVYKMPNDYQDDFMNCLNKDNMGRVLNKILEGYDMITYDASKEYFPINYNTKFFGSKEDFINLILSDIDKNGVYLLDFMECEYKIGGWIIDLQDLFKNKLKNDIIANFDKYITVELGTKIMKKVLQTQGNSYVYYLVFNEAWFTKIYNYTNISVVLFIKEWLKYNKWSLFKSDDMITYKTVEFANEYNLLVKDFLNKNNI